MTGPGDSEERKQVLSAAARGRPCWPMVNVSVEVQMEMMEMVVGLYKCFSYLTADY